MYAIFSTVLLFTGSIGILAATELPLGSFAQLGVATMSLSLLLVVFTRTFPKVIKDIMSGHAAANDKVCEKLEEMKNQQAQHQLDQMQVLREFVSSRRT
jgi:hypothetical protein